mmetsp:Transcript_2713/g.7231  ORF Transcript_2713/g.7231 Transcript_2713/m.7231 type:complete len:510 (-) Transcript_2713:16017-17546(-)
MSSNPSNKLRYRDTLRWQKSSALDLNGDTTRPLEVSTPKKHSNVSYYRTLSANEDTIPGWLMDLSREDSICVINGAVHIYLMESNGWVPLLSSAAMTYLVDVTGGYAPVNYEIAAKPYIEIINRRRWPTVILGNTFTQGYRRFNFRYREESKAEFIPVTSSGNIKENYCTIPTQNMEPIHMLDLSYSDEISPYGAIAWIRDVFREEDVMSILWLIGDIHADFGNKRMFILYGPGGVGKSSVVNIIATAVGGNLTKLSANTIVLNPRSTYMSNAAQKTLLSAASSRLATTADIEITDDQRLNMQTIKAITGNDMSDGGIRVNTTILATMNRLYRPTSMADQARADIIRRVTVIPTRSSRKSQDIDTTPIDAPSIRELIVFSIRTRLRYSMVPLSSTAVLHTIYHGRYSEIEPLVEEYKDATIGDCLAATMFILWTLRISNEQFQNFLHRIGSDCCVEWNNMLIIARIRLRSNAQVPKCWYPEDEQEHKVGNKSWSYKTKYPSKKDIPLRL